MTNNIKYQTLEVYSDEGEFERNLPQHAFIKDKKGIAVALCDTAIIPINDEYLGCRFESLTGESIDESTLCPTCATLSSKLINRESEIQIYYDNTLKDLEETSSNIKSIESDLKKLKLVEITLKSDLNKCLMKAKDLGIDDFL